MTLRNLKSVLTGQRLLGLSVAEWTAFGLYSLVLVLVLPYHEPWADEAQAWLIGRDLSFSGILHQARYEGTPVLWFCLLKVLGWLHVPYLGMRWFSGAVAAVGVVLILRCSVFPLPLKLLLPFTFWIQYQYAVVSRNYVLFAPLVFAVAALYRERWRRFGLLSVALAVLAQVSSHALLFSGALSLILAFELWQRRSEKLVSGRTLGLGVLILVASLAFALYTTRPPNDATSTALTGNKFAHFPMLVRIALYGLRGFRAFSFSFSIWPFLSGIALASLVAFLYFTRRLALLLPFLGVWMLEGFIWQGWHAGLLFISFTAVVWMALGDFPTASLSLPATRARIAVLALLFVAGVLQLPWTWYAVTSDRKQVYCPSQQVASFLQQQHGKRIYGFRYQTVAILPYFKENIFANQDPAHSYWHFGKGNYSDDPSTIESDPPDIAVIGWSRASDVRPQDVPASEIEKALAVHQYGIVQEFCGSMFMRNEVSLRPCFVVYERMAQN
jgi:hypothetical protein